MPLLVDIPYVENNHLAKCIAQGVILGLLVCWELGKLMESSDLCFQGGEAAEVGVPLGFL